MNQFSARLKAGMRKIGKIPENIFWSIYTMIIGKGDCPPIKKVNSNELTPIDSYWGDHTVYALRFHSAHQSKKYIEWRFKAHPLFRELSGLYGTHAGETIVDYGCGPGNDIVGFAIHSRAAKIIGLDISEKALFLASKRLSLHKVDLNRIELIQISDSSLQIPLEDQSVDSVNCQGVLMHTSNPKKILKEFYRILKNGGTATVMVYNRDSIWYHLFTAYERMIVGGRFKGLSLDEAFSRNTDGESCPVSRCYSPQQFAALCKDAGFKCEYMGGHFTREETDSQKKFLSAAIKDARLAQEQREFLRSLRFDEQGLPLYNKKYAGVGGIYILSK